MKKKLALLLALAMIISSLPMNVFGAGVVSASPSKLGNYVARDESDFYPGQVKDGNSSAWRSEQKYIRDWKVAIDLSRHTTLVTTGSTIDRPALNLLIEIKDGTWAGVVKEQWGDYWIEVPAGSDNWIAQLEQGDLYWLDWPDAYDSRCLQAASYPTRNTGAILRQTGFERNSTAPKNSGGGNFSYEFTALSATQARLKIFGETVNLANPTVDTWYALIEGLYILANNPEGTVTVTIDGHAVEAPTTRPRSRDLTVSVANPTASTNFIYFDELYIAENNRGDLSYGDERFNTVNGQSISAIYPIVTLWTPSDYRWVRPAHNTTQYAGHQVIGRHAAYGFRDSYEYTTRHTISGGGGRFVELASGSNQSVWDYQYAHYINHNASTPYSSASYPYYGPKAVTGTSSTALSSSYSNRFLSIHLPLQKNEFNGAPAERLSMSGLGLSVNNAAEFEDVSISYFVDWVDTRKVDHLGNPTIIASYNNLRVGEPYSVPGFVDGRRDDASKWKSFKAGTRAWNELEYGLRPGESVTTIRSGDQGLDSEYYYTLNRSQNDWKENDLGTVDEWKEAADNNWTGWIRLQENAVGAWGAGLGMDVSFNVPDHGGAVILGAMILFPEDKYTDNAYPYSTLTQDWEAWHYASGHGEVGGWNFPDARGVLITPNYVRITPPLQNWYERTALRHIDIRFLLSVEPGYEDKYGPDIEITVTGPSVANLKTDNVVVAAVAQDPITIDVDVAEVFIEDNRAYNVAVREVNDIVITETDYGMLRKGSELWVYVVGARANELEFGTDIVAEVNTEDSGLVLTRGSVLRHRWSNSWVNGMRFTVEERSHERASRANSNVGEIVLTGGVITGPVYPSVESYKVVVSGSAVAANNYSVFENRRESLTLLSYDLARNYSWRLFDSEPYSADAVQFSGDVYEVEPPAEVDNTPAPQVAQSLTLNEWSPEINGVKPFVMVQVDSGTRVGMVSPRVIAEFFGGSADWDPGTGTATITGYSKDGQVVEVTLQAGATSGTINGQSHDIATYSGSAAPGLVSVYTSEANNFYVPMRFMTNAFGYSIEWNAVSATATIRN